MGKIEYIKRSALSGEKYDVFDKDVIRILNPRQSAFYVSQSVPILDVQLSKDNCGKPILVYLFRRSLTKECFDLWCKQKEGDNHEDSRS